MSGRVVVFSPAITTGGPELLHQLVDSLRQRGVDAHICYYPLGRQLKTPERYRSYDVSPVDFIDDAGTYFIVPETATWLTRSVRRGRVSVWWLSVDNHYGIPWAPDLRTIYHKLRHLLLHKVAMHALRRHEHFHQSEYARLFLEHRGMRSLPLSDYLGRQHVENTPDVSMKQNIIAYNPKKGFETTRRLRARFPQFDFAAIENMTEQQVSDLLSRSKIYIDFGSHPGKDRIPREAAMAGCCVITGRRGSAANPVDVPIPEKYKIPETASDFYARFEMLVMGIFSDFETASGDFDAYRDRTRQERAVFEGEVSNLAESVRR